MPDTIRTCAISGEHFTIDEFEQSFIHEISPTIDGTTYSFPLPQLSPTERRRLRLSWRNIRKLFSRTCDYSGKKLISSFPPDSCFKVFHTDVWWSDVWDPLSFGREYDFSRPFFSQFFALMQEVPVPYKFGLNNENCEYINGAAHCKDCYLCFNLDYCNHGFYLSDAVRCVSCIDCSVIRESELCYDCTECERCYDVHHAYRSVGCTSSLFLSQCAQCRDCIGCVNLVGKENYIFNKKASPSEVRALRESFKSRLHREAFSKTFENFIQNEPLRSYYGHSNEESSGDVIKHCRDAKGCFQSTSLEHARHCFYTFDAHHCVDLDVFGDHSSWLYQDTAVGLQCERVAFSSGVWSGASNVFYSTFIATASNLFGCSGIRNKEYCILNKQYSKSEYESLLKRIIHHMQSTGEWGAFFPASGSHFPYNDTVAQDYFPLSAEEAQKRGYQWRPQKDEVITPATLITVPDSISDVDDSIIGNTIKCCSCSKNFKIDRHELVLRKECGIPVPVICHECRYQVRHKKISPLVLRDTLCGGCGTTIEISFKVGNTRKVLCEKCYEKLVY